MYEYNLGLDLQTPAEGFVQIELLATADITENVTFILTTLTLS